MMEIKTGSVVLDDWIVTRRIGKGASGTVYEIRKEEYRGAPLTAALKVIRIPEDPSEIEALRNEGLSEESVTTYLQKIVDELVEEIKTMVSLKDSAYVVRCEDYKVHHDKDSGQHTVLIRMELLQPLPEYQRSHDLTEADVHKIAVHLAKVLVLLEDRSLIHRDIKPENIFVNSMGDFKLGDFGIARVCDEANAALSQKGTQNYMAPEVFRAESYDRTVDIYSLGLVLYKYLNRNRLPFLPTEGDYGPMDRQSALAERLSGKKQLPDPVCASPEFAAIIRKMCAFRPEDRYASAKLLLKDLDAMKPSGTTVLAAGDGASAADAADNSVTGGRDLRSGILASGLSGSHGSSEKSGPKETAPKKVTPASTDPPEADQIPSRETPKETPEKKTEKKDGTKERPGRKTGPAASSGTNKKKNTIKKMAVMVLAVLVIAAAMLVPFLLSKEYSLVVKSGSGSGNYKAKSVVTVTADSIAGKSFTGWDSTGLNLSEDDTAEETITVSMPRHKVELTATYANVNYSLTVNGGTGGGDYLYGDAVSVTADDAEEGYEFTGWTVQKGTVTISDSTVDTLDLTMPAEDMELTAVFEPIQYTLTVNGTAGSGDYAYGEKVSLTAGDVDASTFTGWQVDEGDLELTEEEAVSTDLDFTMPAGDLKLTAVYEINTHTVTVTDGTGGGDYAVGDIVDISADTAPTGMEFSEWKVTKGMVTLEDSTLETTSFTMPDRDVSVVVDYDPISYTLTVVNATGSGDYDYGESVSLTAEAKTASTFVGWQVDDGDLVLTEEEAASADLDFTMPAGDLDLTAVYEINTHTVTVTDGTGGGDYAVGDIVDITADAAADGMEFAGWKVTKGMVTLEDSTLETTSFTMPDRDVSVRVDYDPISYTLTVVNSTGSGDYDYGESVSLTAEAKTASTFVGWQVDDGDLVLTEEEAASADLDFIMPAGDLELTAVYEINTHTVTVTDGTGGGDYAVGDIVDITADAAADGMEFAGWKVTKGMVTLEDSTLETTSFTMPDRDVNVKVLYDPLAYTLTVVNATGSGDYDYGESVSLSAGAVDSCTFSHWEVNTGTIDVEDTDLLETDLSFTMPAEEVKVTAVYDVNTHSVTVNNGTGGGTYAVGDTVDLSADAPDTGYEFSSWTVTSGTVTIDDASLTETSFTMPDQSVTVSAVYELTDYEVVVNNGTGGGTYQMGDAVSISPDAPEDGMFFAGWTVDYGTLVLSDTNVQNVTFVMPAESLTFTAHFALPKKLVTVTDGTGNGLYTVGDDVTVTAEDTNEDGEPFVGWTVDAGTLDTEDLDMTQTSLTFVMPDNALTLKANYGVSGHILMVNGGTINDTTSSSGFFEAGETVTIVASESNLGLPFKGWLPPSGYTEEFDQMASSLEIVMPDNDVIFNAFFGN